MHQIPILELLKCKTVVIVYKYSEIVRVVNGLRKILNDRQAIMVKFETALQQVRDIMSRRFSMAIRRQQNFMSTDKNKIARQQALSEQVIRQIPIP